MPAPGCPTLFKPADRNAPAFAEAAQQGLRAPLSRMSGSALPTRQRKPAAERAERAETSNPSEIAAFSTMARRGGNPAETGGNPLRDFARETVRGLAVSPTGCSPSQMGSGNCGKCGN